MKSQAVIKVVLLLFVIGLLSGCASTKLLGTNYEGQNRGDFPNLNGSPPIGDRISFIGPRNFPNSQERTLSVLNDNTVSYVITATQGDQPSRIGFHAKPENLDTGWYRVTWTMLMRGGGPGYTDKPLNIRITSGADYNNWMFDMVLWPGQENVGYIMEYGSSDPNTFQQVRPYVRGREMTGFLDYREEKTVVFMVNITTREYYITLPGFISPTEILGEIAPASNDLSASPTLWFSYGEQIDGGRSMDISKVSIYRARNEDDLK